MMVDEAMPIADPNLLKKTSFSLSVLPTCRHCVNRGFDQKAPFNEPAERSY
jgi:hypothetical protein